MIKIKRKLKKILMEASHEVTNAALNIEEVDIQIPRKKDFGDFSSNIAMKLAGKANINPLKLANEIKNRLIDRYDFIEDIRVMGSGFINFYIKKESLMKEHLKMIEDRDFKELEIDRKNIKISIILERSRDILTLQGFRFFMNMYYLGNIYSFAGYKVRRIVLIKDYDDDLSIKYLMSNFKDVEVTLDEEELRDSITFCSSLAQGLFTNIDGRRFIVEGVSIYRNGIEVYNPTLIDVINGLGIDRIKYTLANEVLTNEAVIELTRDDLRYIQYPYSRIDSIIKLLKKEGIDVESIEEFNEKLMNVLEKELLKKMADFKTVIMDSINQNQPYRLIKYVNELSEIFYRINSSTLFRQLSHEKLRTLLKLLSNLKILIKEILTILDVPVYERM